MKKELKVILCILLVSVIVAIAGILVFGYEGRNKTTIGKGNEIKAENNSKNETEEKENAYFYGKVIEAKQNYIIVEPNENEAMRKSADKISISLGKDNDAIYQVGQNVKVTYKGYVMETYPAQVDVVSIELKSAEKFEIHFQKDEKIKANKIIDKTKTNLYDFDVYVYKGSANITINNKEMSLKDALLENKITVNELIAKANEDLKNKKITGDIYKDGGSKIYQYETYTIIKYHTIEGNRDVYIGPKGMTINEVK